jgi:hypothetical protein
MIVFDLACPNAHVFEAWFGSTDDYEAQRKRGLVSCPLCGSGEVAKAVMAPNVSPKGNRAESASNLPVPAADSAPMRAGPPLPAEMKAALAAMAQIQAKMLEKSEHVGSNFAREARAIHEGESPERVIHGQATAEEAKALVEDGVPVAPLPFPVVAPGQLQ